MIAQYVSQKAVQLLENSYFLHSGSRISSRLACCLLIRLSFNKSAKLQTELIRGKTAGTLIIVWSACLVIFSDSEKITSSSLTLLDLEKKIYIFVLNFDNIPKKQNKKQGGSVLLICLVRKITAKCVFFSSGYIVSIHYDDILRLVLNIISLSAIIYNSCQMYTFTARIQTR